MKVSEWLECVALIAKIWPRQPLPPQTVEAWYPLLADLPAATVQAAIHTLAMEPDSVWPPSLGQLRAACDPPARPWEDAFADLQRLVARHGAYAPTPSAAEVGDAALVQVIASYGWRGVCMLDPNDSTVRAQFRAAYTAAAKSVADARRTRIAVDGVRRRRALTAGGNP